MIDYFQEQILVERKGNKMKRMLVSIVALAISVSVAIPSIAQQTPQVPFAQRRVELENGIIGKPLTFESANPRNFEEVIGKSSLASVKLDGQLFVPAGTGPHAVVILAPGSRGVTQDILKYAQELTSVGLAVYALDPFAGRGIKDTVSDQGALTRAASSYDVLAAARMLAAQSSIDRQRIGALGCSRGGLAVLLAAQQQMTKAVLGEKMSLKAIMAAWPACSYQFEHPTTAPTAIRLLVGDSDNWVSPVQCQGQATAMLGYNPRVSIRFFEGAYHGFGGYAPVSEMPKAETALRAPIIYMNDQGAFLDMYTGKPIPGADDAYARSVGAPWRVIGPANVGTKPGQTKAFVDDMVGFFKAQLKQ
jgi:dienelactone hydrolase